MFWQYALLVGVVGVIGFSTYRQYKKDNAITNDPFYERYSLSESDLRLYQYFFDKILEDEVVWNAEDVKDLSKATTRKMNSVLKEADQEGLSSDVLNVMIHQYIYADVMLRGRGEGWVYTVMRSKRFSRNDFSSNYFPSATTVFSAIKKLH